MVPLLRPPQVLGSDDCFLDPAAEADVDDEDGAAAFHDRARHAMEPVVGPTFLHARSDDARHPLPDFELGVRPRARGEPALARAAAELPPRLLLDPFRG